MLCIAVMESGNHAIALSQELENAGVMAQVISTPCKLAKEGCGYSLRFDMNDQEAINKIATERDLKVRSYYRVSKDFMKSKYQKIQK